MTYIVVVIDEYADLVMTNSEVEDLVVRLAQKARACGISLLIATQRPSASIISPTYEYLINLAESQDLYFDLK